MNKAPERLKVSDERAGKIRKKYGYSEVYVFSPSFLEEYKDLIVKYFPSEEQQQALMANMNNISEFVIGDRVAAGLSRLCCSSESIQMDIGYADITDDSFRLKDGYEYIETVLVHELLHAATRQKGNSRNLTGILEFVRDESGKVVGKKNVGLNEGITQFLAEKITGRPVPNKIDSYAFNKQVVSLLADVLGDSEIESSYFEHTDALKDRINALAQDENYFDELNKRLDTINKLEVTIRRIKRGTIKPQDPESLARMEAVVAAQREALMESLFSKVVLPQVQTKTDKIERQQILLPILLKHEEILRPVAKYISRHPHSEWVSDEIIASIQKEISEKGMDFSKIAEAARRVNENLKIGPKVAKSFIGAVDDFYSENTSELTTNRSTKLTPLLRRQLEGMVTVIEQFEKTIEEETNETTKVGLQQSLDNYMIFLKKHFHMVPNLEEEIERIKQEKRAKKDQEEKQEDQSSVTPPSEELSDAQSILDDARRQGQAQGQQDVHQERSEEEQQEEKKERKVSLADDYVIDNITGAVINQKNASIYERARNIAKATGTVDIENDPKIVSMSSSSADSYMSSLTSTISSEKAERLQRVYGANWQEVIRKAYEEGYQMGMKAELAKAQREGLEARNETLEAVRSGNPPQESISPIDLDEVKFVYDNFEIRTKENGEIEVVDKESEQVVTSERTRNMVVFANEWVKTNGEQAFSSENAQVYRFIQTQASKDLKEKGSIDLSELAINAEAMGPKFQSVTEKLFATPESVSLVDKYFRVQTPDAKAKQQAPEVEVTPEERAHSR